jgi:hypothetical protein
LDGSEHELSNAIDPLIQNSRISDAIPVEG